MTSEQELIRRAQGGDQDAFCLLAKSHQRRIYSLALHYCRDTHEAEDLSQEVWLKAYRAIRTFRGESSFYTWLRRITIHCFLNYRRGLTRMIGQERTAINTEELNEEIMIGRAPSAESNNPERLLQNKMLIEKVMTALSGFTRQQTLIFLLKHREGMTYDEIAKSIGCSVGTVKKTLFRTVTKLRDSLGVTELASVQRQ